MKRLWEYMQRLLGFDECNETIDDSDSYDCGTIMNFITPGEKIEKD